MPFTKGQLKEMIKELFKDGDIDIYVTNEGDSYFKTVTTTIEVYVGGESVYTDSSTAHLGD